MAAAVFDSSQKASFTGGALSITTTNWTIANVANRCVYHGVLSGASSPANPSGSKWQGSGGTALTQQGSTLNLGSFWKHSLFRLIAPTAATSTSYANWASSQDEGLIEAMSFNGIDQTTPNNTVATATGNSLAISVAATSVSGDLVADFAALGNDVGAAQTIAVSGGQTSRQEIEGATTSFEAMGCSTLAATGTSTTMSWTISGGSSADTHWGTFAFATNGVSGGGGTTLSRYYWDMIGGDDV